MGQESAPAPSDSRSSGEDRFELRQVVERAVAAGPSRALWFEVLGVVALTCLSPMLYAHVFGPGTITATTLWLSVPAELGLCLTLCALLGQSYHSVWSLPASREAWWEELGSGLALFVVAWLLLLAARVGLGLFNVGPRPLVADGSALKAALQAPSVAWAFSLTQPISCACEEILFRVYLPTRLTVLFRGGVLRAILAASVLFSMGHGYGFRGSILMALFGVFYGFVFYRTGRLPRLVLAHVLNNALVQLLG